jgi:hypothetical protein
MKKILLLLPLYSYVNDITKCDNYNSVIAFFFKKYLEKKGYYCTVVPMEDTFTMKGQSKSNYSTYKRLIEDTKLIDTHDVVIILGIKSLRNCDERIINSLKNKGKQNVLELDETSNRADPNFSCIFMMGEKTEENSHFVGQGVDLEFLYPDKSNSILTVHIDHPWPSRVQYFEIIQQKLLELQENQIYKKYGFNELEIMYHTIQITDIKSINENLIPPNISFLELSKIYRKTHVGFISHRETMGNYPLEMAATGATVILPYRKAVPGAVMSLIKFYDINMPDFWETVLINLKNTSDENVEKSKEFSYESVTNRISKILGD